MSEFLTMADVLAMHDVLINRYGGSSGVRDMGALEAALYRPQSVIMRMSSNKPLRYGRV